VRSLVQWSRVAPSAAAREVGQGCAYRLPREYSSAVRWQFRGVRSSKIELQSCGGGAKRVAAGASKGVWL